MFPFLAIDFLRVDVKVSPPRLYRSVMIRIAVRCMLAQLQPNFTLSVKLSTINTLLASADIDVLRFEVQTSDMIHLWFQYF